MNIAGLLPDVLGRIEESNPPIFWSLTGEVYPQLVWGMFEASLISGAVQLNSQPVALAANTTYFSLQDGGAVPNGVVAAIRMTAPYGLRKTTLKGLDDMVPGWQQEAPGTQIRAWFPLGVSGFGIYPQLANAATVTMDFISCPVNEVRPYTGSETIPFQSEFAPLISKYAAAMLRAKEGGAEAEEAATVFQAYLAGVKSLSLFQRRVDSLTYSAAFGGGSEVNTQTEE